MGRRGKNKEPEEVVPDEFRCKRSDGKQWRCGARAVEGKSMCEKHIGQAKKRAAGAATKTPAPKRMKTSPGEEHSKRKLHKKRKTSETPKKLKKKDSNEIETDSGDGMETDDEDSDLDSTPPLKSTPKRGKNSPDSRGSDPPSSSKSMDIDSGKPYNDQEEDSNEKETKPCHTERKFVEKTGSPRKGNKDVHERKLNKDGEKSVKNPDSHERKLKEKTDDYERKVRFKEDPKDKSSQKKMKAKKKLKQNLQDSNCKVKNRPVEHIQQKPERKKNKVKTEESEDMIKQRLQDSTASTSGKTDADTKPTHSKREVSPSAETLLIVKKKKKQRKTCHQCQRSDKEDLIYCLECKTKQYCLQCISRWYPDVKKEDFEKSCPVCCGNCNCKSCQHMNNTKPLCKKEGKHRAYEEQRVTALQYMLSFLLPHLRDLDKLQKEEVELEAKIKGVSYVEVRRTALSPSEQIFCDNCNATIVDVYRTCTDCGYDLCLTCCQELREGKLQVQRASSKIHSEGKVQVSTVQEDCHGLPVWKVNDAGSIPCPSRQSGGCGSPHMALRRIAKHNYISRLVKSVEDVIPEENLRHSNSSVSCQLCSKDQEGVPSFCAKSLRKAANRADTFDNFIYCPSVKSMDADSLYHFQKHWLKGEPVIVRDVLDEVGELSWDPLKICLSFQEAAEESKSVKAIDCRDWSEVEINIHEFLTGYRDGRKHKDGSPEMLKLRDWPPSNSFFEKIPNYVASFISMLPFHDYTHPTRGMLNLATKCPDSVFNPNLGPKTYIAYGAEEELGYGGSVSQLHCHMFDVVNILTHASELTWELDSTKKLVTGKHEEQHHQRHDQVEGLQNEQNLDLSVQSNGVPHEEANTDSPTNRGILMEKDIDSKSPIPGNLDDGSALGVVLGNADGRNAPQDIEEKGATAAEDVQIKNVCLGEVPDYISMEDAPVSSSNDGVISSKKECFKCENDKIEKIPASTNVADGDIFTDNPYVHDAGSSSHSNVLNHSEDKVSQQNHVNATEVSDLTVADAPQIHIVVKSGLSACERNVGSSLQETVVDASQSNSLNNGECSENVVEGMENPPETIVKPINSLDVSSSEKPVDNTISEANAEKKSSQDLYSSENAIDNNISEGIADHKSSQNGCSSEKSLENTEVQGTESNNIAKSDEIQSEEKEAKTETDALEDHSEAIKNNQGSDPGTSLGAHVQTGVGQNILSEERKSLKIVHDQTNGTKTDAPTHHLNGIKLAPGGAVWDVFRHQDVPKLEAYLKSHWREFQHTKEQVENVHSPIHEQTVFLNDEEKKKLKEEYGIEPWTFEQCVGEAVLIPAGCPHQVRNKKSCMKVALEFVTPESVQQCICLADEYRKLPKCHRMHKDKLEVTKLVIFAAASALKQLNHLTQSSQKAPEVSGEIGH